MHATIYIYILKKMFVLKQQFPIKFFRDFEVNSFLGFFINIPKIYLYLNIYPLVKNNFALKIVKEFYFFQNNNNKKYVTNF